MSDSERIGVEAASELMNVSVSETLKAREIQASGRDDLIAACEAGTMTLDAALAILHRVPWRDKIRVHPAADMFEMMPDIELEKMAHDIDSTKLNDKPVFYTDREIFNLPRSEQEKLYSLESVLDGSLVLLDGRNRLEAIDRFSGKWAVLPDDPGGRECILFRDDNYPLFVVLDPTTCPDPVAYAFSANEHRRHSTPEARLNSRMKRAAAEAALRADPERSNRDIANAIGASDKTVGAVRAQLVENAEIPHLTRTGRAAPVETPLPPPKPQRETEVINLATVTPARRDFMETGELPPRPAKASAYDLNQAGPQAVKPEPEDDDYHFDEVFSNVQAIQFPLRDDGGAAVIDVAKQLEQYLDAEGKKLLPDAETLRHMILTADLESTAWDRLSIALDAFFDYEEQEPEAADDALPPDVAAAVEAFKKLRGRKRDAALFHIKAIRNSFYTSEHKELTRTFAALQWRIEWLEKHLGRKVAEWPELQIRVGGCGDNNYWVEEPQTQPVFEEETSK